MTVPIATRILIANVRQIGLSNVCVINLVYFKMQTCVMFVESLYRPLSRHLDRCDRVIQDEVGDSNGGNV